MVLGFQMADVASLPAAGALLLGLLLCLAQLLLQLLLGLLLCLAQLLL